MSHTFSITFWCDGKVVYNHEECCCGNWITIEGNSIRKAMKEAESQYGWKMSRLGDYCSVCYKDLKGK